MTSRPPGPDRPTVSVAIRGYRANFLREAIASVLAQTFTGFELLIYDDAGDLDAVVAEFGDERIRHVHATPGEDSGTKIAAALNLCRGRHLGTLDDDDLYAPTFLERVLAEFERDPRVGLVFTNHYWDVDGARFPRRSALRGGTHHHFLPALLRHWPVALSAAILRREAWEQGERAKPIPPGALGDRFTWLRTAEAGWSFTYIDEPLVTYRVHPAQMSRGATKMREHGVTTLEAFEFEDEVSEDLRRRRLAEALLARAAYRLGAGQAAGARADLARAASLAPRVQLPRRAALRALATVPPAAPAVARVWRRRPQAHPLSRDRAAATQHGQVRRP
jgi:glycosyltransferase involved in cell wall biosynthesis